jgi:hypothetical protein
MPDRDAHEGTAMKVPGVVVIVLCSWGASILIPLTLWSAASRTGPFRRASDEARLAELDRQRPPVAPQVPGHVRVVLPHSATDALAPKNADDVVLAQTSPLSRVNPPSPSADEAADEPALPAPSAQPQQPAQAVQAAAAEPPRASTADALDDRRGAESQAGAGASLIPIFMRVPQLPTVHDEDFAPRPQAVRRREAALREEFRAHKAAHSYHYRRVMVRRWAPANPFVSLARLLFH